MGHRIWEAEQTEHSGGGGGAGAGGIQDEAYSSAWSWNHISWGLECILSSHGDLGKMAYTARLELALRGRDEIGRTI